MKSSSLDSVYRWGIRSAFHGLDPKELKGPWYNCDQRREFQYGREKGKKMALKALVTGQEGNTLTHQWNADDKYLE